MPTDDGLHPLIILIIILININVIIIITMIIVIDEHARLLSSAAAIHQSMNHLAAWISLRNVIGVRMVEKVVIKNRLKPGHS